MGTRDSKRSLVLITERGTALIEFSLLLPILIVIIIILTDLCILLDHQLNLIHLGREAANALSRGTDFTETFEAIKDADGALELDGGRGKAILTRVEQDPDGLPIIVAQQTMGRLNNSSSVGTLPNNQPSAPANIPNGRTLPPNMSLVVVELFSLHEHFLGNLAISPGQGTIVLHSRASF